MFAQFLNQLDPAYRANGEALHTVRTVAMTRILERQGLPMSATFGMEPAEFCELFDRCQQIAARYLRTFGQAVRS